MNAEWDLTGLALYVNLEPDGQEDAIDVVGTTDLGEGVLVDVDADGRPTGVEVLLPRPSLTEEELRVLIGCALVQSRVFDDDTDIPAPLQWHPCMDDANCRAAQNLGPCACTGIPYISDELWAQLAPVMKIAAALPEGTEPPMSPPWLADQVARLAARRAERTTTELSESMAQMRQGEGRTVRPGPEQ